MITQSINSSWYIYGVGYLFTATSSIKTNSSEGVITSRLANRPHRHVYYIYVYDGRAGSLQSIDVNNCKHAHVNVLE